MPDKGKNEAQTMEEMLQRMTEAKDKGLSPRRGQSVYKAQSGEYQEEKLRALITRSLEDVANFATKEKVSLENVEDVQQRTVLYLRACLESGTFPSCLGLARSLGYSDRALRNWRKYKPDTPTARWLEMFNDLCSDLLSQSALKNNANSIMSIFLNKALYELRETSEIVVTPHAEDVDAGYNADEIRRRYLVDE